MIDLLRSEWIKFRTVRVNYVLGTIGAAFPMIVVLLVSLLTREEASTADDLPHIVTGTTVVTAFLLGVVGALNLTSEYSHGTIRTTFAAAPQRTKVLFAKALVTCLATIAFTAVVELVTLAIGSVVLSNRNVDVHIAGTDRAAMLGAVAVAAMLALLGFALGLLIRNSAATVAVLVLWPFLLEGIVGAVLSAAGVNNPQPWLPYQSALTMTNPDLSDGDPSRLRSGLFLAAVIVVLAVIGTVINERRDA
jgi:ABC-2 type transport system permease protein